MNLNGGKDFNDMEASANRFNMKIQFITLGAMAVITILNLLDIFIIDDTLMFISLGLTIVCTLVTAMLFSFCDKSAKWVKYMLLTSIVIMLTAVGIALTYHVVFICVLPIICSVQYRSRGVIYYVFAISVVSIFITVMAGYFFGLCDANMLLLTTGTAEQYYDPATGIPNFKIINQSPWTTLPVYYASPRIIIMFIFVILIRHISDVISSNAVKEATLRKLSETDTMTQLYNKNKYVEMIENYYPNVKKIGVIFWDVNGLKHINDTMGHDYGDYLISTIASSIIKFADESSMTYRIGGDEFVMIAENPTEDDIKELIRLWKEELEIKNMGAKIRLSAAVGYAYGSGEDIDELIKRADADMYENKKSMTFLR